MKQIHVVVRIEMTLASQFSDMSLSDLAYNGWLKKTSEVLIRFTYCCKHFDIANMGEHALKTMTFLV